MRTTERMIHPAPAPVPSVMLRGIRIAVTRSLMGLASGLRIFRNRKATNSLLGLDDHLLRDIGLSRQDLHEALHESTAFGDPTRILNQQSRVKRHARHLSEG